VVDEQIRLNDGKPKKDQENIKAVLLKKTTFEFFCQLAQTNTKSKELNWIYRWLTLIHFI